LEDLEAEGVPTFVAGDEADVESEEEGEEVVCYCDGDGRAVKSPVELLITGLAENRVAFGIQDLPKRMPNS
jgi:hypothetical protein